MVLWIGFCLTGLISLCVDSFMFMFVYFAFICFVLYIYRIIVTQWGGPDGIDA